MSPHPYEQRIRQMAQRLHTIMARDPMTCSTPNLTPNDLVIVEELAYQIHEDAKRLHTINAAKLTHPSSPGIGYDC